MSRPRALSHEDVVAFLLAHPRVSVAEAATHFACSAAAIKNIARLYDVLKGWVREAR